MNERIRELMIQSSMVSEVVGNPNGLWTTKMSVKTAEKFAELIVKECADICMEMAAKCAGLPGDGALAKDCAYWIKKDFGVDE
jgi:uncharacterized protein YutE (UPF0331/DUF86 family)